MAVEIERKFLVHGESWKEGATAKLYCQGYLSRDKNRTVRVRRVGTQGFITVKGATVHGCSRSEYEYEIPLHDAQKLLDTLCYHPLIEKYRYLVGFGGMVWEVDEFLGANSPLVVAEIELASVGQQFEKPVWLAEEVTADVRYFNSSLSVTPFSTWK